MNSFRFVQKALEYEINRQIEVVSGGGRIIQETRLWDSDRGVTVSMRSKEEAHDYRYFPEPDLVPLEVSTEWQEEVKRNCLNCRTKNGRDLCRNMKYRNMMHRC